MMRPADANRGVENIAPSSLEPGSSPPSPFIEISVTDPAKQGDGMQAYVLYRVSVKTNLPGYKHSGKTFQVLRRFRDFVWLFERLSENHKGIILPSLPERNLVEKFRFNTEFIESRRRGLEAFLSKVVARDELRCDKDLVLFLEASEDAMSYHMSLSDKKALGKTTGNYFQMFKSIQSSISSVVIGGKEILSSPHPLSQSMHLSPSLAPSSPLVDEEGETLRDYADRMEKCLFECQSAAGKLVKRKRDYALSLSEFGLSLILLGEWESEGAKERSRNAGAASLPPSSPSLSRNDPRGEGREIFLSGSATTASSSLSSSTSPLPPTSLTVIPAGSHPHSPALPSSPLGVALLEVGKKSDLLAAKAKKEADDIALSFEEPLNEFYRSIFSLKRAIADRASSLKHHSQLSSELDSKKMNLERMKQSSQPLRPDKVRDAEFEIQEAQNRVDEAEKEHRRIVEVMSTELRRFHIEKAEELRRTISEFSSLLSSNSSNGMEDWASLLPLVGQTTAHFPPAVSQPP